MLMQTHLAENLRRDRYGQAACFRAIASYTAVYARFGLLGPRSLFGHCIHLDDAELALLRDSRSVAVFCPTSNLLHRQRPVRL